MSEPAEGAGRTKTGLMGHLRPTPVPMQIGPSQAESELAEIPSREFRIWTLNPRIVRFSCTRHNGFGAGTGLYVQAMENHRTFARLLPCMLPCKAIPDGEAS